MSKQTTAETIAEQARDIYHDTIYSAISAEDIQKADAYTDKHLSLTVEVMSALGVFHASDRLLVAIAQAMRATLDDIEAEQQAAPEARAARALIDAYAEAIGEHPAEDDPETCAALRMARFCITGRGALHAGDRATVAAMVEAIADRWAQDHAPAEWDGAGYYRVYADATERTGEGARYYDNQSAFARDLAAARQAADDPATVWVERIDARPYQRCELEAYLGEHADDYDVDAIEAEATEWAECGELIWRHDIDLAQVCAAHDLTSPREWHMVVSIDGSRQDFAAPDIDADDEDEARELLRRAWNRRKERRLRLPADTARIIDVYSI